MTAWKGGGNNPDKKTRDMLVRKLPPFAEVSAKGPILEATAQLSEARSCVKVAFFGTSSQNPRFGGYKRPASNQLTFLLSPCLPGPGANVILRPTGAAPAV